MPEINGEDIPEFPFDGIGPETLECLICGERVPARFLTMVDHSMKHEKEE